MLVTGAGRGLGAAIAERCVGEGATVLVGDIAFVDEWGCSATDRAGCHRRRGVVPGRDVIRRDYRRLDVLVNNAGILRSSPLRDMTVEEFRHTLDVNVIGPLHGIQTFLELHDAAGGGAGSIVNIASVRGLVGGHGLGSYSASKFALRGLTKVAAIELGSVGVRVNAVCPGPVVTEMMMADQLGHLDWDGYLAQVPVGRFGRPDDIAAAVCWLASDDSSFVSGTEIVVDGGLTASGISPQPRRPREHLTLPSGFSASMSRVWSRSGRGRGARRRSASAVAPGVRTAAMPAVLELVDVGFGDDAADDHGDVDARVRALVDDERGEGHVGAGQHRQPDRVDVLVDGGGGDGLGRLEQAGVDDLVAGVAQDAGDDLDAAVVPVEADLGDQDPLRRPSVRSCASDGRDFDVAAEHVPIVAMISPSVA